MLAPLHQAISPNIYILHTCKQLHTSTHEHMFWLAMQVILLKHSEHMGGTSVKQETQQKTTPA